ncbi:MAG: prolipoprotein diacylglyceryl transferase [Deltaproteobacteria bacterium]|nr:prolipoprotein diacylglyceryl transferase [Deltaproteobacteria bacterium]
MVIPWFTLPPLDLTALGLGKLYWFAVLVVAGIILGVMFYDRITLRGGDVDVKVARLMPEAAVIGGFIGAHLVHVLLYHPELMDDDPWILLKFWAGISSMGGFFGGALACIALLLYYRQRMIPYGDRALFALSIGWVFGRLGCATSHDHPGRLTDFFLAVQFHDGARHDLGLYEFIYTVLLVGVLFWWTRRPWRTGSLMAIVLCSYGPLRFGFDFLRATDRDFVDARYWGLTPAQYGSVILAVVGAALLYLGLSRPWPIQPPLWGPLSHRGGAPPPPVSPAESPPPPPVPPPAA